MTINEFKSKCELPGQVFDDEILQSLYLIKQDNWDAAHNIAQDNHSKYGSLVHGLLHRIEGDQWNASYWYRQAGEPDLSGSIDELWEYIAKKYIASII
ncbi:hypothetical protein [Portibacter lacus]|uniref:Uncharacterized protein n=1 Tax=Portibacter lacus TaxID=1099794 RepID=A0AA37WDG4_9BACT|nr:hypothetical protein [Portibacter lacus]GLR15704.1 hypothetical protein GCM10007940_03190 [Portibacter lacus]